MALNERHNTRSRAQFHAEFGAALKAIKKLPPKPPPTTPPVVQLRPNPETEASRSFRPPQQALKLGYFARDASHVKGRDETTVFNESMFMARNLAKAGR